jgi:Tol biopolymer transport system component
LEYVLLLWIIFSALACNRDPEVPREEERIPVEIPKATNPDWFPDGSAITTMGNSIYFYDAGSYTLSEQIHLLSDQVVNRHIWSNEPENPRLVFVEWERTAGDRLMILDDLEAARREEGEPRLLYTAAGDILWPSWSANNDQIAFICRKESDGVLLLDLSGDAEPVTVENDLGWGTIQFVRCAVDGDYLIYVSIYSGIANIYRIDLQGGVATALTDYTDPSTIFFSAEVSPDGATLAYAMTNGELIFPILFRKTLPDGLPDPISSNVVDKTKKLYRSWWYLSWSPDGEKIVCESRIEYAGPTPRFDQVIWEGALRSLFVITMETLAPPSG